MCKKNTTSDLEEFIKKKIDNLERNENNNDPFEERTVPILQQVFEKFQIFPHDLQTFPDIPIPVLQIKRLFHTLVDPVQILILPGLGQRVENIQILGNPILEMERFADIFFQMFSRYIQPAPPFQVQGV